MKEITQIRKLSLWIFIVPLLAINLCLIVSQNYQLLENTIFAVAEVGKSNFTIPYLDGSLSISRASRGYPQFLIFKPSMFLTAVFLFYYWRNNNNLVNNLNSTNINYRFKTFGILSAFFLIIHSILLGVKSVFQFLNCFDLLVFFPFLFFEFFPKGFL